jgi:hypothetical protein
LILGMPGLSYLLLPGALDSNYSLTLYENECYAIFAVIFAEVVESVDTPS